MIDMDKFVIIILCHCRPYETTTVKTLRQCKYTGQIILLLDDEDPTIDEYRKVFKNVIIEVFSKDELLLRTDLMNNKVDKNCAVYARNACFDVAKKHGFSYFCQMDDDYVAVPYRYGVNGSAKREDDVDLDLVFRYYLEFMDTSEKIGAVAFAEPGDFIGGLQSNLNRSIFLRKCMGSWMCFVDRPLVFSGIMNDDVNCYATLGSRGTLFYTFPFIMIDTPPTQSITGGMTDVYLGNGTYMKTAYTMICCPSFVKIGMLGNRHFRIHHNFNWKNAVPKLISDRYKKE